MRFLLILIAGLLFLPASSYAQFDDLLDKVKSKVEDKANEETDEAIDKTVDDAVEDIKNGDSNNEENQEEVNQEEQDTENPQDEPKKKSVTKNKENETSSLKEEELVTYSKFDFISGEQILFYDDFSTDAVGDFPEKWNTNASGEVVTMNKFPGKWFSPSNDGVVYPEINKILPENYTLEFDVMVIAQDANDVPEIGLGFIATNIDEPMNNLVPGKGGAQISFRPWSIAAFNWRDHQYGDIDNQQDNAILSESIGKPIRVSIWVQKQRMRLYMNEKKVIDIPRLMYKDLPIDRVRFYEAEGVAGKFYITNFRLAVGAPDMRSKLITEGKLVTRGILFDSGSDKIKPESYGTLKEISAVLKENSGVKVQIVGHTDADGNDASNLDLSKRRAASVKNALMSEFGIEESRMSTDGKGESVPVSDNNTSEGKANNRRVEFIKM